MTRPAKWNQQRVLRTAGPPQVLLSRGVTHTTETHNATKRLIVTCYILNTCRAQLLTLRTVNTQPPAASVCVMRTDMLPLAMCTHAVTSTCPLRLSQQTQRCPPAIARRVQGTLHAATRWRRMLAAVSDNSDGVSVPPTHQDSHQRSFTSRRRSRSTSASKPASEGSATRPRGRPLAQLMRLAEAEHR